MDGPAKGRRVEIGYGLARGYVRVLLDDGWHAYVFDLTSDGSGDYGARHIGKVDEDMEI